LLNEVLVIIFRLVVGLILNAQRVVQASTRRCRQDIGAPESIEEEGQCSYKNDSSYVADLLFPNSLRSFCQLKHEVVQHWEKKRKSHKALALGVVIERRSATF